MKVPFVTLDVFTDQRFGGNQLAVILDGRGISDAQMQAITREFNFSETVFVLPPEDAANTRRLRIFTPGSEVPFAGHPTVGTAHALAATGAIPLTGDSTRIVFEEGVGLVPVEILSERGVPTKSVLTPARLPEVSRAGTGTEVLAALLSIAPEEIIDGRWYPETGSAGLPFLFVPVRGRETLGRCRINPTAWDAHHAELPCQDIFIYCFEPERFESHARARMFAPDLGVAEDPATGSAASAFAGVLASREEFEGTRRFVVEQGFEMGRPSILEIEVTKSSGALSDVRVGGASVMVTEGTLDLG